MKRRHEQVLVAALAGIIIASAAAFAVQPALAERSISSARLTAPADTRCAIIDSGHANRCWVLPATVDSNVPS